MAQILFAGKLGVSKICAAERLALLVEQQYCKLFAS
jgi:hypothetical protein